MLWAPAACVPDQTEELLEFVAVILAGDAVQVVPLDKLVPHCPEGRCLDVFHDDVLVLIDQASA